MEFVRGDPVTKGYWIPTASWTPGGRLFFAAKQLIDDDNTDAAAVIKGNWDDSVITDQVRGGVAYKRYACSFPAAATNSIVSNGAETLELLGEFQWVPSGGGPVTSPPKTKIPVIVYMDVNRKTTP